MSSTDILELESTVERVFPFQYLLIEQDQANYNPLRPWSKIRSVAGVLAAKGRETLSREQRTLEASLQQYIRRAVKSPETLQSTFGHKHSAYSKL